MKKRLSQSSYRVIIIIIIILMDCILIIICYKVSFASRIAQYLVALQSLINKFIVDHPSMSKNLDECLSFSCVKKDVIIAHLKKYEQKCPINELKADRKPLCRDWHFAGSWENG